MSPSHPIFEKVVSTNWILTPKLVELSEALNFHGLRCCYCFKWQRDQHLLGLLPPLKITQRPPHVSENITPILIFTLWQANVNRYHVRCYIEYCHQLWAAIPNIWANLRMNKIWTTGLWINIRERHYLNPAGKILTRYYEPSSYQHSPRILPLRQGWVMQKRK